MEHYAQAVDDWLLLKHTVVHSRGRVRVKLEDQNSQRRIVTCLEY